jgi:hypothetical protein
LRIAALLVRGPQPKHSAAIRIEAGTLSQFNGD